MRKEREVLKHQPDAARFGRHEDRRRGDFDIADRDPALIQTLDPGDHPQQRGLAAAGRAEKANDFTWRDVETEIPNGGPR